MTATMTPADHMTPATMGSHALRMANWLGWYDDNLGAWVVTNPVPQTVKLTNVPCADQFDVVVEIDQWMKENILRFSTVKLVRAEKEGDNEYIEFMGVENDI